MDPDINRLLPRDELVARVRQELISELTQSRLRYVHELSRRFAGRDGIIMARPVPEVDSRGFDSSVAFVIRVVKYRTREGSIPFIRIWRLGAANTADSPMRYAPYGLSKYPDLLKIAPRTLNDWRVARGWKRCAYNDMVVPFTA